MTTCTLNGRCGNQFYIISMMLAYCKKYNLNYYIPDRAYHLEGNKMYFPHLAMGPELSGLQEYHELPVHAVKNPDGTYQYNIPAFQDIPLMNNIKFIGYWQSFKYFDEYRDYILEKFDLPYSKTRLVSLHIRRGDFTQLTDKHPDIPLSYYQKAVEHFDNLGYHDFLIFSDDIAWCKRYFTEDSFYGNNMMFQEEQSELSDLVSMSWCEHNILCYSTFCFVAAWLNRNPDKQVIIPPRKFVFSGSNQDFIPNYFTELNF